MAETAGELSYRFSADTGQLTQQFSDLKSQFQELGKVAAANSNELSAGLQNVQASASKLSPELKAVSDKIYGVAAYSNLTYSQLNIIQAGLVGLVGTLGTLAVGFATIGVAAVAAVGAISAGVVSLGVEVKKMAGDFDQSTESISAFANVANRSGIEVKDLGDKLNTIQENLDDSTEKTTRAIGALGLSVEQLKGKSFPDQLKILADRFSTTADSSNKTAIAVALFGEEMANKLLPQLNRGSAYLDELQQASQRAGSTITAELSDKIQGTYGVWQKLGDAAHELGEAFKGIGITIYETFKPAVDGLIQVFADLVKYFASGVEWINQSIRQGGLMSLALDAIAAAAKGVVTALALIVLALREMLTVSIGVMTQSADLVVGLAQVFVGFFKDLAANSVAAFGALWAAAKTAATGIGQVFSDLGDVIAKGISGDFSGASAAFKKMQDDATAVGQNVAKAFELPGFANTSQALQNMWDTAKRDAVGTYGAMVEGAKDVKKQIEQIWGTGAAPNKINQPNNALPIPDNDNTKAAKEATTAVERYIESLNKAYLTAQAEAQTWNLSNVERAKAVALAQAQAAADRDGIALTEEQRQKVIDLATATQSLRDQTAAVKDAAKGFTDSFASSLDQLIVQGRKLGDVLTNLANTLASSVLKGFLTGEGGLGGLLGGQAGSGGALGSVVKSLFGGFRAGGGDVSGGQAYIVGEQGPELFLPNGGGSIVPNNALGGGGGGGGVVVNIVNNSRAQVSQSQRNDGSGGKTLDVVIDDLVGGKISQPGASARLALQSNFGLNPVLAGR